MANIIKIKRGIKNNLPILARGELAYATDTNELFIGVLAEPTQVSDNILVSDLGALDDYFTKTEIEGLAGTGLSWNSSESRFDIDNPFDPSGNYEGLRAQATTAEDVGLENVTNESKVTMFTDPEFTGFVKVPLPTNADAATNKSYVDALAQGIKSRTQALILVEGNLAGTYDDQPLLHELTASADGPFPTTDGIDSSILNVVGTRIVLAGQTNKEENGLYVLKEAGDSENPWVLHRCTQCDTSEKIPGSYVFVQQGTKYNNTGWLFDVDDPTTFVLGTGDINVIQFSGVGTFTAGTGLKLEGVEFSADLATTEDAETGTDNSVLMTPKTTKDAIDSQTGAILTSANYVAFGDAADQQDAEDGTRDDVWMSPLRTKQAIEEFASIDNLSNIGDVTITNPQDGEALVYDSVSGDWINSQVSGVQNIDAGSSTTVFSVADINIDGGNA